MWLDERPSAEAKTSEGRRACGWTTSATPWNGFGLTRKETERAHSLVLYDERPPWTVTRKR